MQRPRRCINIFIWLSSPSAYYHPELKKKQFKISSRNLMRFSNLYIKKACKI